MLVQQWSQSLGTVQLSESKCQACAAVLAQLSLTKPAGPVTWPWGFPGADCGGGELHT